jgi:tubulin-specific chaperone A
MVKEVAAYEKEVVANETKIAKMKEDRMDEYDIKKQEEVLAESLMMVPDSKNRLEAAVESLNNILSEGTEGISEALVTEAQSLVSA